MVRKNSRVSKTRGLRILRPKWLLLVVLVVVTILGTLQWRGTIDLFRSNKTKTTIPSQPRTDTPSPTKDTKSDVPASTTPTPQSPKQDTPAPQSGEAPITPYGDFVSNHHPNLSGSPAPSSMVSVCNSTPGANCYIEFTKDSITKKLDSQTTDGNGSAYWRWDIKDAGLTAGSWEVKAVATLNSKTATASDVQKLEVQP